jgi:L-lactate dehydrogenase complex protein LldG
MSKAEIFNRIRAGLHVAKDDEVRRQAVRSRLQAKASNIIPKRAQLPTAEMMSLFLEMAKESAAEVIELGGRNELARAVENWLSENGIDHLVTANDSNLTELSWSADSTLIRERRPAQVGDEASLTNAFCAIAETGTVMLYSGEHSPTTLNFLPDCHLIVVSASTLVGPYEDAWARLREQFPDSMPRTVNLITGPSRSADIEQRLQMGAHGPRRLIIFMLHDE